MRQKQAMIEAILFSMGESVSKKQLMTALDIPEDLFFYLIDQLKRKYNRKDSGIRLLELDGSYQLCTRPEYYDQLIKIVNQPKKPKLTDVMMETLSIIAYKQPVTKQEIEAIRGVKCDLPVKKLLEYNLIREAGLLDAVGRPILFRTTEEFLRCFGVGSIKELPEIEQDKVEDFKQEAQEEVKYALEELEQN